MSKVIYPLDAPGLPLPGPEFLETARARGDNTTEVAGRGRSAQFITVSPILEELIEECLFGGGSADVIYNIGNNKAEVVTVVGGHKLGIKGASRGPERADVMIIGKMLGINELKAKRHLGRGLGEFFIESALREGATEEEIQDWYVTSVLKSREPEPDKWRASWINGSAHLLQQELRLVRPKFILCLGTAALKALFGNKATLSKCEGKFMEYEFQINKTPDEEPKFHKSVVMGIIHPHAVLREPELADRYGMTLGRFVRATKGKDSGSKIEIDHRVITTELELSALLKEIDQTCPSKLIAVDAEWHGEHPQNSGSYLRCIQISWAPGKAACIVLHGVGGKPAFKRIVNVAGCGETLYSTTQGGSHVAIDMLRRFFEDKRVVGHYFTADLEWLVAAGLDLREQYKPADSPEECKEKGGLDTALMAHALNETDDFSLNGQIFRYLDLDRYDTDLIRWKEEFCKANNIKAKHLEGYGDCPDEILYPYANMDADATRRLAVILMDKLDSDRFGNNCWRPFWITHGASIAILEMKMTGLLVDRRRIDELAATYMVAEHEWGSRVKEWSRWPNLNMQSAFHMRELLFGTKYNGKLDSDGRPVRLRPANARSLNAVPVLSVGKRPLPWTRVVSEGKVGEILPSSAKQALGIMFHNAKNTRIRVPDGRGSWRVATVDCTEILTAIRNYKIVSHVLKSVLRKPKIDETHDCYMTDDDDNWIYDDGVARFICDDDRIRTTIYPTKETGRWSSANPPMQNWGKKRESDYKQILGSSYRYPLRSIITADPGHVLIEADYIGAELFVMAVLSGDELMIEHAQRNQLPETHPQHYDIHSQIAKLTFNLPCEPTKAGLASIGMSHLRIVSKAVIFGVAYGRQAKAISVGAQEEGVYITEAEAQQVVDTVFATYTKLKEFFAECRDRVNFSNPFKAAPGYLVNCFGRYRRFMAPDSPAGQGEIERQAMNFPVQSAVADAVSLAVRNLYNYRKERLGTDEEVLYRLVLQIHDAIMLSVPIKHVARVVEEVIPNCMIHSVPIYQTKLDGTVVNPNDPYYLGVDTEIYKSWGVTMLPDELSNAGISPELDGWTETEHGWHNSKFGNKVWIDGKFYNADEFTHAATTHI